MTQPLFLAKKTADHTSPTPSSARPPAPAPPPPTAVVMIPGLRGRDGSPGVSGASYEFTQATPSAQWLIPHNLNRHPSVAVVDSSGSLILADVQYLDVNTVQILLGAPFSGRAYLN